MIKSHNTSFISYIHESFTNSPRIFTDRNSPYSKISSSNTYRKLGILAINSEKKYSLLSVPKISLKPLKENKTPSSRENPLKNNDFPLETSQIWSESVAQIANKKKSLSSRYSILSSNRFRPNPNYESLQKALREIEKTEKIEKIEKIVKETIPPLEIDLKPKSDIEKIIESNRSYEIHCSRPQLKSLNLSQVRATTLQSTNRSNHSDPSPTRAQRPKESNFERSKSSTKSNLKLKKSRINHAKQLSSSNSSDSCPTTNYKEASIRILKNTSFLAKKVMKQIRYSARKNY